MSAVRLLHTLNSATSLAIGAILNCLLIFLIRRRTSKEMSAYKRILLQTCFIDLYVLVIGYLLQPIYFVNAGQSSRTWNGPFHNASTYVHFVVFCLWIVGNFLSSASMTMQFVYRYLLLCRNITISYWIYLISIIIPGLFCVVWMNLIFNFTSGKPPPTKKLYSDSDFYHLLRESPDEEFVEVSVTGTQGNVPCIVGCLTMNFAFYLVIFLSSFRMKMFIKKQKERMNAEKYRRTERQMNYILAAQGILPAISLAVHTFTLSGYILFPETSIYFLLYLTIPVYWLPVVNPLSTMLIVKSYRNFLLEKVGRRRTQSQVTLTAVMSSPTHSRSDVSVFARRMTSFNEKEKRHTIT